MPSSCRSAAALSIVCIALGSACSAGRESTHTAGSVSDSARARIQGCPGDNAGLTLQRGFCASVFADSLVHARHIVVAPNGDVYVTLEGTSNDPRAVHGLPHASFAALRDTNNDGRADIVKRLGTIGNTGIGIFDGHLYVDEGRQIVRYAREDTALIPTGRQVVLSRIPLYPEHRAHNFAFGPDGYLYLNVGSGSDNCQLADRQPGSHGKDPCEELIYRAGIWRYEAQKLNQFFSPAQRFATGLRNSMGLAFGSDGKLYGTQHGRDQLHENWPRIFPSVDYGAENPGEELIQINQGDDFGWPYCYYAMDQKKLVDAPEYGGDGTRTSRCINRKPPLVAFPGHWAPMSMMFYTGTVFPDRYRHGTFIAFHGSWNRWPRPQAGYRVVFQPLVNGTESGPYETFANGFAGPLKHDLVVDTATRRPAGLATSPDGAIFVTDDAGGRIYRITYHQR
jgi:Glucose/sorbosone dehydrogenases